LDGSNTVGSMVSSVTKNDPQYGFSSSGPWTTFYTYGAAGNDTNSTIQAWHMLMGDGYGTSGSSQSSFSGTESSFSNRRLLFASGNRIGPSYRNIPVIPNPTSYTGVTFHVLPIRNTTSGSLTCNLYWMHSANWSAGYEGSNIGYFMPDSTNAPYSTVSSGSWTSLNSTSGTTSVGATLSASFSIPANTTALVMGASSWYYYTTYQFYDTNMFYALNSTFTGGLICDMRMLATLAYGRFDSTYSSQNTYLAYPACAALFGDR